ncbi:MAG: hypothetical protein K5860_01775 [Bacteroidales bacterium]|nr:hypothetical protein [Bacteroidales bacterium]
MSQRIAYYDGCNIQSKSVSIFVAAFQAVLGIINRRSIRWRKKPEGLGQNFPAASP